MTQRVENLRRWVTQKEHHGYRQAPLPTEDMAQDFSDRGLSAMRRTSERFCRVMAAEKPVVFPGERIALIRTVPALPALFTKAEWEKIRGEHFIHEAGMVSNLGPGYAGLIRGGLDAVQAQARQKLARGQDEQRQEFYEAIDENIAAIKDLCQRYRREAEARGNRETAEMLAHLPGQGARSFMEALQMLRILHYALWVEGEYHNTLGRFDQYMWPYLQKDLQNGVLDEETALELVEEFFLSLNRDSDLYFGVQQGDNGQSMVLGGCDAAGNDCFNALSRLCLQASRELKLIDPKINLRVEKHTPQEIYDLGTLLTKEGLGFPQYCNDDVVIPGLVALGYAPEDAAEYTVAACWEFIIPGKGMDIPNIGALSFPGVVQDVVQTRLPQCQSFEELMDDVKRGIQAQCDVICGGLHDLWMVPAPFMSAMMDGCLENGRDISMGCVYNNYGLHGTGLSTAADSLAAIQKYVFETAELAPGHLLQMLEEDFAGEAEWLHELRYCAPKMGNNDDAADSIACRLLDGFAGALRDKTNERGGVFRAGTGSAMFYLWHAAQLGAGADGRRAGEPFAANYAPSLFAKPKGPLSVVQSFTKPDFTKTINGGPLTMEFHDSIFRDEESTGKVAQLVRFFIQQGGHQFQLNAVNREVLRDAQKHPEEYPQLIVRIWGWSAYFVELDKEFQDHVIARQEYGV